MSSWLPRPSSTHNGQLIITAVISGVLVAGSIFGLQQLRRQIQLEDLKRSIPAVDEHHEAEKVITLSPKNWGLLIITVRRADR